MFYWDPRPSKYGLIIAGNLGPVETEAFGMCRCRYRVG